MVVKDTRIVKTKAKSSPERTPLRRISSLESEGARKIIAGLIEGSVDDNVVTVSNPVAKQQTPHYQRPTMNSSNHAQAQAQARVQYKPLTTPSPDFFKVRRFSLGLESADACKYESKIVRRTSFIGTKSSGLKSPRAVEKTPVKINGLKSSRAVEKTPVKINGFKPSRAVEKTPVLKPSKAVDKTPRSFLSSKVLKVARDTCSSSCKHVIKGGDLTISPEPSCPYHYCSLNHLDRENPPPIKQFLASRRRLLKTQKSFKWVGLTPAPKTSEDTGDRVETESVVDTGQELWVGYDMKDTAEGDVLMGQSNSEGALVVGCKYDDDCRPEACQVVDCDDYDDGHSIVDGLLLESEKDHENDELQIAESSVDHSDVKVGPDESMELFGEKEDVKVANHEIAVEAEESIEPFAENDGVKDGSHDLEVDVKESMELFAEDEGVEYDSHDLDVETEESMEQFAEDEDVKDDSHEFEVEASGYDMACDSYDQDRIEDNKGLCFVHVNTVGTESSHNTQSDSFLDPSFDEVNASLKDSHDLDVDAKESMEVFVADEGVEDDSHDLDVEIEESTELFAEDEGVADDSHDLDVETEESMELFAEDEDVKDDDHEFEVEASDHDMAIDSYDNDRIEDDKGQCFVHINTVGTESNRNTQSDSFLYPSFAEVNASLKDEVREDVYISGSFEDGSVSQAGDNDHIEHYLVSEDDHDQTEKTEQRCFVQVNALVTECSSHKEPEGLSDVSCSDVNSGIKDQVKEEYDRVSESFEGVSVSEVSGNDHAEQFAACEDDYDQIEDTEQRYFVQVNAFGNQCSSQIDSDGLADALVSEVNTSLKDEAKEELDCVSENSEGASASDASASGYTEQFSVSNDDQSGNDGSGHEITEHNFNKYNEFDSSSSGDGKQKCYIQVDTVGMQCSIDTKVDIPSDWSVIEPSAGPKQESTEESIHNAGNLCDGFDDDYNLTSLFDECKDDSSRESELNCPIQVDSSVTQFSFQTDFDSRKEESLFEFSINPKVEEEEDINSVTSGEDGCASEIHNIGFEEHYSECEDGINESLRTSSDFDDGDASDTETSNDMRAKCCDISGISLNDSVTECKSLKRGIKKDKNIAEENENKSYRLKFRRGRVHPFDNQMSEAEKVALRHQMIEERRATHEWMLDYALTKIVKKLSPFRQRKVELLVEAFETVTPLAKCETKDSPNATREFTCIRPIQACN